MSDKSCQIDWDDDILTARQLRRELLKDGRVLPESIELVSLEGQYYLGWKEWQGPDVGYVPCSELVKG